MRILLCDDDVNIQKQLMKILIQFFHLQKLGCPEIVCFDNGEALLEDKGAKDIVFLDVEMPGVSGISVGKVLMQQNPNLIIFIVTSFSAYLDDAMRFHVFRYLSKPIEKQRLFRNMKDALVLYNSVSVSVPIETKQGVTMVLTSDIIMVEAKDRKVYLYTPQTSYECIQKMDYWTKALPKSSFFASHRSYIVNMKYVTDFDHSLIYLFHRKYTAYLTRRKYTSFKEAFLLYAGSMQ